LSTIGSVWQTDGPFRGPQDEIGTPNAESSAIVCSPEPLLGSTNDGLARSVRLSSGQRFIFLSETSENNFLLGLRRFPEEFVYLLLLARLYDYLTTHVKPNRWRNW